ncbi:MAG: hypothetical protein JW776_02055 [Candidatus Lokiarchaeota archaeon]|nr:hypothetical protein [Candidatus Lokiarchaeota archaeon]
MVIPSFERSLDLLIDNQFELSEEEVDQLYQILSQDPEIIKNLNALTRNIDINTLEMPLLKKTLKEVAQSQEDCLNSVYEEITKDERIMAFIQKIILDRLLD